MQEYVLREYLENIIDYYLTHSNGAEHYAYGIVRGELRVAPSADVVPINEVQLHHIFIDENGIPEIKLQFGETSILLRGDPINFREIVYGHWIEDYVYTAEPHDRLHYKCSVCGRIEEDKEPYCNCGAKMDLKG